MHRKLALILTMLAVVIGTASQAQAAVSAAAAPLPAARPAHAWTHAPIAGHGAAATNPVAPTGHPKPPQHKPPYHKPRHPKPPYHKPRHPKPPYHKPRHPKPPYHKPRHPKPPYHKPHQPHTGPKGQQPSANVSITPNEPRVSAIQSPHHSATGVNPPAQNKNGGQQARGTVPSAAPPAPTNLVAVVVGPVAGPPAGVKLTWTNNAPITLRGRIQRAPDDSFTTGVVEFTTGLDPSSYPDTTAVEGRIYCYRVRSETLFSGNSGYSSPAVCIKFATVPAAPTHLTAAVVGPLEGGTPGVNLAWTDNATATTIPPATQVHIQRATDVHFSTGVTDVTLGAAVASYSDTGLTGVVEGTTYYYHVRAENQISNSAWSRTTAIKYATVPIAPTLLRATVVGPADGGPGVKLTWRNNDAFPPATQVHIQCNTVPDFPNPAPIDVVVPLVPHLATSLILLHLVEGKTYYCRIRAENKISNSAWSSPPVSILYTLVPAPLNGVAAKVAGPVEGPPAGVELTWRNSDMFPRATQVRIQCDTDRRFIDPAPDEFVVDMTHRRATSGIDRGAVEGETYYCRGRAETSLSHSDWAYSAKVTFATVPAAPTDLGATVGGLRPAVKLIWKNHAPPIIIRHYTSFPPPFPPPFPAPPATVVSIERASDPGFQQHLKVFTVGPEDQSYTDRSVVEGRRYFFRVRALNGVSWSTWSGAVSILAETVPAAPSNLAIKAYGPGPAPARADLSWTEDPASAVSSFTIERATDPGFTLGFASVRAGAPDRTVTLTGLRRNTRYYVAIQAINRTKVSPWVITTVGTPK